MSTFALRSIAASDAPALNAFARSVLDGTRVLSTAAPRLSDLDRAEPRSGPVWSDPGMQTELHADHRRWGAEEASHEAVDRLAAGASCVITGQQPGLLLGPLYTAYKILGAIALARELQRRHARPVVPVFWCGADDSDFDEVRSAWLWRNGVGPYRAELARDLWRSGQRVGSVRSARLAEVERAAVAALGDGSGRDELLERLSTMEDLVTLADRAAAWALRSFPGSGLVVVDARSPTLRARGADLFARYVREHGALTELLRAHSRSLREAGWPTPIDDRALGSGLFLLDGEIRRKLGAEELTVARGERSPSVLLRPLWQDAMLGPIAAVLGPAELQYHAQIAPLYGALDVGAARPVSRPHLTLWPASAPWIEPAGEHAGWLGGGESLRSALVQTQLPPEWATACSDATQRVESALAELGVRLQDGPAHDEVGGVRDAHRQQMAGLRRRLAQRAMARAGLDLGLADAWLRCRGVAQERCYAAPWFWAWMQSEANPALESIATEYAAAIDHGRSPTFVLRGGTAW